MEGEAKILEISKLCHGMYVRNASANKEKTTKIKHEQAEGRYLGYKLTLRTTEYRII